MREFLERCFQTFVSILKREEGVCVVCVCVGGGEGKYAWDWREEREEGKWSNSVQLKCIKQIRWQQKYTRGFMRFITLQPITFSGKSTFHDNFSVVVLRRNFEHHKEQKSCRSDKQRFITTLKAPSRHRAVSCFLLQTNEVLQKTDTKKPLYIY